MRLRVPTVIRTSRDPDFDRAVVLATDRGHFAYALFTAQRIDSVERARDFDICIVAPPGTDTKEAARFPNVRIIEIDFPDLEALPHGGRITAATYFRVFLPEALERDYRRLLYIDTDVYLARAGLREAFEFPMDGALIGAVPDLCTASEKRMRKRAGYLGGLEINDGRYFNAGVLLFDVAACARFGLAARLEREMAENAEHFRQNDQSVLNKMLAGRVAWMNFCWNWPYRDKLAPALAEIDPVLIHFLGARHKPWSRTGDPRLAPYFQVYEKFLSEEFPGHQISPQPNAKRIAAQPEWLKRLIAMNSWQRKMRYLKTLYGADLG